MFNMKSVFAFMALFALAGCAQHQNEMLDRNLSIVDIEMQNGEVDTAIQKLKELNRDYPNNQDVILRLAEVHRMTGKNLAAVEFYKKALKIDPNFRAAWMGLSKIYLQQKPETSLSILENLVKLYPADPEVVDDYGVALDLNGRYADAQNAYRRAISLDPSMVGPEINLGLSLGLTGHVAQGLALIRPYAIASDASQRTRENYALLLIACGKNDEARAVLQTYMSENKTEGTVERLSEFWQKHAVVKN